MSKNMVYIDEIYAKQKAFYENNRKPTIRERLKKIERLSDFIKNTDNQKRLCEAIYKDFKKPKAEVDVTEIFPALSHLKLIRKNLKSWAAPDSIDQSMFMIGTRARIYKEPKGQTLIIAPWNYPFLLTVYPVFYAIAAGCVTVIKPSELSPHTSQFIQDMMEELFAEDEVAVIQGAVPETTYLLDKKWHHIFFTGSPKVGKIVMEAASKYLASVTLELGGKSPCIIDDTANIKSSVNKLMWGKFVNAGQTCIAPDYVILHRSKKDEFIKACKDNLQSKFGDNIKDSDSFARIINEKNFDRVDGYIKDAKNKGAKAVIGGNTDKASLYVEPTILTGVDDSMEVMQDEIFAPILPVVFYDNLEEVLSIINSRKKPLSMYICSVSKKNIAQIVNSTSAGGTVVNDFLLGAAFAEVPFGGVNNSGIGKSYGYHGFIEFCNERPIIDRRYLPMSYLFPPYTKSVDTITKWLKRIAG